MSDDHDRPADSTTGVECVKKRRTSEVLEQGQDIWVPDVSVLMPCRNAMPWLPDAVASCLQQEGLRLELIAVDDGSSDGSYEFLTECEELCKQLRSLADSHCGGSESEEDAERPSEPELPGSGDAADTPESKGGGKLGWIAEHHTPLTAREVASKCLADCRLRVFAVKATGPSGQGLALNLALRHAKAPLIGEMEADDLRAPDTFKSLSDALEDPDLDAVASQVELIGWPRDGMRRYSEWQNIQQSTEEMARCRFVEIPAMRASALYRRDRIIELGGYRDLWEVDGAILDCACSEEHTKFLQDSRGSKGPSHAAAEYMALTGWWPVDSDFWMRFFAAGMKCIKIPRALYSWRQYPSQSTRTHNRCSIEQLRTCKIHFIACPGGPLHGKRCQVWSVGITLEAWGKELEAAGVQEVELVSWKPGRPLPKDAVIRTSEEEKDGGWVRVFVYGSDKARDKVRRFKGLNFDIRSDWFAA